MKSPELLLTGTMVAEFNLKIVDYNLILTFLNGVIN